MRSKETQQEDTLKVVNEMNYNLCKMIPKQV